MRGLIAQAEHRLRGWWKSRQLLGFLHIPKTAGTSLVQAMVGNFAADRVMPDVLVYDLENQNAKRMRQKYDLLYGHVGMDVLSPVATQIVTVVREPTDRVVSLYNYWRSVPIDSATVFEGGLIDPGVTLAKELSFRDFIECGHQRILNDIENGQAFQIAVSNNDQGRLALQGCSEEEIFVRCQTSIARMVAVGRMDHMDDFTRELQRRTGITLNIAHHNPTRDKQVRREDLPADLLRHIRDLNVVDYQLYEALGERKSG